MSSNINYLETKDREKVDIKVDVIHDLDDPSTQLSDNQTVRGLKSRHMQLIALGGAIGTGLFIGTGSALATCGPAGLLVGYLIISVFIWFIMNQLGEMVTFIPVSGEATLYALSNKYASKAISFAAGWNIYYAQAMIPPAEITACSFVIKYWTDANSAIFISIFIVITVGLNFLPVKYYGESEFCVSIIKIICITGLIIVGIVIFFGGAPKQDHVLGFHYWNHPGAFVEHIVSGNTGKFLACWTAVIKSGFSFIVTPELITSCASESEYPRKNIPIVCRRFIYRLLFFYIISVLIIGVIVASNNSRLMGAIASGVENAEASPFVIGIEEVGINVLPHIINACILTSAYSCGTSLLYGSSRALYSMALKNTAPKIFAKTNSYGVPVYSVGATSLFSLLAYLNCSDSAATVFSWLSNIATIAGFVSWIFVSITYLRFRKVIAYHNLDDRITFRPPLQIFGAWSSIIFFTVLCLTNGYAVFFPGSWSISDFFTAYITLIVVVVCYTCSILWNKEWNIFKHPKDVYILHLLEQAEAEEEVDRIAYEAKSEAESGLIYRIWRIIT